MTAPALTLAASLISVGIAVFSGWRGALPPNPLKGPRLIPWRAIMLLATTAAVALAAVFLHQVWG